MEDIGKEADRLTRETGIKHEVDHIHPLRGKLICGLQCPANLQILTKSQNCSKRNKFTPYVESESVTESSNFDFLITSQFKGVCQEFTWRVFGNFGYDRITTVAAITPDTRKKPQ